MIWESLKKGALNKRNVSDGLQQQVKKVKMSFGIEALEFYAPKTFVDQTDLQKYYGVSEGKYTRGLGQLQLSFATQSEDVNSLALTVVNNLMKNNNIHPEQVGRLEVGTETLADKSKSTKTVLMQLFKGFHDIEGATSINACYGGTNALLNTLNWMSSKSWDGRYGIVVAVDIAVYQEGPARPTGGAGAVAMLISKNPKIIINLTRASFIDHEWDFYKPNPNSEYPVVDGKYSMGLYLKALKNCYLKFKEKIKRDRILEESNFFCFHCPFAKMVQKAFESLIKIENPNISSEDMLKRFKKEVEPLSQRFGNIYNGSLYLCLLSLFFRSTEIKGQRGLLFSYGSGLCSTMMEVEVKSNPISECQKARISSFLSNRVKVPANEYSKIMLEKERVYGNFRGTITPSSTFLNEDAFYLTEIDEKWRRNYAFNRKKEVSLAKNDINFIQRIPGLNARIKDPSEAGDISKFYKLSVEDRRTSIEDRRNIKFNQELLNSGGISTEQANSMIENVIGKISLPLGVVPSLKINQKEYSIPMCIQEPSVVAAVSSIAKLLAPFGIISNSHESRMIGQVHLPELDVTDSIELQKQEKYIIGNLNQQCQSMVARGGGVKQLNLRKLSSDQKGKGNYSLDIVIDVCDAMGANIVNTISERAKQIVSAMGIKTGISILSNYCLRRMTYSQFKIPVKALAWKGLEGQEVANKILEAYDFAKKDKYRAVTHNKGIMNGIDAVCLATGQDWRAIESAAHAFAFENGNYCPLTHYELISQNEIKYFKGYLQLPISVGTVGGSVTRNPLYGACLSMLGKPNSQQLAQIINSVGLCQNLAALRALAIEGIQKGHMRLHSRAIATKSGIPEHLIDDCCKFMQMHKKYDSQTAKLFLEFHSKPKL